MSNNCVTCERLHLHSCQSFISSWRCAGLKLSCSIYVECVSLLGCSSVDGLLSQSVSGWKRISIINSFCREKLGLFTKPCSPGSDLGGPVLKCHVKAHGTPFWRVCAIVFRIQTFPLNHQGRTSFSELFIWFQPVTVFPIHHNHRPRYFYTLKIVFSVFIEPERPPEDVSLSFTTEYVWYDEKG